MVVLVVLTLVSAVLLVDSVVLWKFNDISGFCMIATSGTTYLDEPGDSACWDVATKEPLTSTMAGCMVLACAAIDKPISEEPFFGQCSAIPLGMAAGAAGIAASAASKALTNPDSKALNSIITGTLMLATLGCALACFGTSFSRWGEQEDQEGVVRNTDILNWDKCDYTYSDARGDYTAMTWFAALSALSVLVAAVSEWLAVKRSEPELAIGASPDIQEQFM